MIIAAGRLESIVPTTAIEGCLFRIGTRGDPWIFNAPATYWDGASAFIRHVADV